MNTYYVLGVMTGSSLDGIDLAYTKITADNGKYQYEVLISECVPMPPKWKLRIEQLVLQNAVSYLKTSAFFGHFLGECVAEFIKKYALKEQLDFIASHGQTVFHQPENLISSQIGDGAAIARKTGFPVVCDFRSMDVALGGQGAPVAPIADRIFFSDYKYFLNLGGIANIAANINGKFVAFDITAANLALNKTAKLKGVEYDHDGNMASAGVIDPQLFDEMNGSWYYDKDYPKSLSGGWVSKVLMPTLSRHNISVENKLRTIVEHISYQIYKSVKAIQQKENITITKEDKMLVTGGGAFNKFLVEKIEASVPMSLHVPDEQTVKFKEAILMALMGVLRVRGENNCIGSVTGAERDSIGGAVYQGFYKKI
jgi:anhydro-N-acetylmuramic acid kinase